MLTDGDTDMHLRYQTLLITLEVEHFSKVLLLDAIEDHGEDGKSIVDDFLSTCNRKDDEAKSRTPFSARLTKGEMVHTQMESSNITQRAATLSGHSWK